MDFLVVTRHPGLVAYLVERGIVTEGAAVIAHATAEQVTGRDVVGVLPLSLAALATSVTEVVMDIPVELRGKELSLEQVRACAKGVARYVVQGSAVE